MEPTIRRIQPDDWHVLRELRLASLLDAPEAFGQTHANALTIPDEEWQQIARASAGGDARIWLISSLDGNDAGLVQARRRPPADCLVFSMWVAPSARRSGVGRLLIDGVADGHRHGVRAGSCCGYSARTRARTVSTNESASRSCPTGRTRSQARRSALSRWSAPSSTKRMARARHAAATRASANWLWYRS